MQNKKTNGLKRFIELKKKSSHCISSTLSIINPQTERALAYKKYLSGRSKQINDILYMAKLKMKLMNIIVNYKDEGYPDLEVLKTSMSSMPVGKFVDALRIFVDGGRRIGDDNLTYEIIQILQAIDNAKKIKKNDRRKYENKNHIGSPP